MNVSVIVPVRNAAETIAATLESLRSQTSPGWEVVVIDNRSSDATARFAGRDASIRVLRRPMAG